MSRGYVILLLFVLLTAIGYVVTADCATWAWYETENWYPPDDEALQVTGGADKVIVWNPAGNDFYLGVLKMPDAAADTTTVEQYKQPHEGVGVPSRVLWLVSSTCTDTLQVLKYHNVGNW